MTVVDSGFETLETVRRAKHRRRASVLSLVLARGVVVLPEHEIST